MEFPLKEIKEIIDDPHFDRNKALEQQIELLTMKKEHLENLIQFAQGIKMLGVKNMDFSAFDTRKIDEYSKRAKEQLKNCGLLNKKDTRGTKKVLSAAAFTYVASFLAMAVQILRLLLARNNNSN